MVGCGWIGSEAASDPLVGGVQSHAGAYIAHGDTELVGLCDSDPARLARAAAAWSSARTYNAVTEMLAAERPEIVSICTPDRTHPAILADILTAETIRAVIIEKPLAMTLDDASHLVAMAERRDVVLLVNYSRRFAASHQRAKDRLDAGAIGLIMAVQGTYTKGILHNGTHWIDLVRWLVGEIAEVQAWPGPTSGADPTCHVRFRFVGGQEGFLVGADDHNYTLFELDLIGNAGRVRLVEWGNTIQWYAVGDSQHRSGYRTLVPEADVTEPFRDLVLNVVGDAVLAIRERVAPRCTGRDGSRAVAIAAAIQRSLTEGRAVDVTL